MPVDPNDTSNYAYVVTILDSLRAKAIDYYLSGTDTADRHQKATEIRTSIVGITGAISVAATIQQDGSCDCPPDKVCINGICVPTDVPVTFS
ncbi:MAG TPA: hypothetical protein VFC63_10340 [Blastocatellia bacterium]|nr:hypothetical protein [Blastocatellia bacterium]